MSLFKRPTWASTETSTEADTEKSIFSHSHAYKDIVADEKRRREAREEKVRAKQERKERRVSAKREKEESEDRKPSSSPKRRRITLEESEDLLGSVGLPTFYQPINGALLIGKIVLRLAVGSSRAQG